MRAMTPEQEMQASKLARLSHVISALMHRKNGNRNGKLAALNCAKVEKLKQMYFIGPCPF